MYSLDNIFSIVKELFEKEQFVFQPKELYEPIDYTLALGGKRIRPSMLLLANDLFGGSIDQVRDAAIGIETFHNFTLLHDDLMDKSPIRRGQPTVYRKWDENTAILSGDTMFALAWRFFLRQPHPNLHQILNAFNETAIGVCEGQQYDMNFEQRNDVSIAEYIDMIRLKTAVLLAGALQIGALYAQAPEPDVRHLYQFGTHIGIAFQLQDDLLDAFGNVQVFGKQTGTDICDNKKTYLILKALELGDKAQCDLLRRHFSETPKDPSSKVREVLEVYKELNLKQLVEEEIANYFHQAFTELDAIQTPDDRKLPLRDLANRLLGREK